MFLPWWRDPVTGLSYWAVNRFTFIELALVLTAGSVLLMLYGRAEGRGFHLPLCRRHTGGRRRHLVLRAGAGAHHRPADAGAAPTAPWTTTCAGVSWCVRRRACCWRSRECAGGAAITTARARRWPPTSTRRPPMPGASRRVRDEGARRQVRPARSATPSHRPSCSAATRCAPGARPATRRTCCPPVSSRCAATSPTRPRWPRPSRAASSSSTRWGCRSNGSRTRAGSTA